MPSQGSHLENEDHISPQNYKKRMGCAVGTQSAFLLPWCAFILVGTTLGCESTLVSGSCQKLREELP